MSYLSELIRGKRSLTSFVAKSTKYIKEKLGAVVDDEDVDEAVQRLDQLTDTIEVAVNAYIKANVPMLPAQVVATTVAHTVLQQIDLAIAAAGNVIKENN